MKATIIRGTIDGTMSLHIEAESADEATLVEVLLADWRDRRQYVAMAGGPVTELHRDRRPYFAVCALPRSTMLECMSCGKRTIDAQIRCAKCVSMMANGNQCRCTHEQGDTACPSHPRCPVCGGASTWDAVAAKPDTCCK